MSELGREWSERVSECRRERGRKGVSESEGGIEIL